jgi:hypothetical protein
VEGVRGHIGGYGYYYGGVLIWWVRCNSELLLIALISATCLCGVLDMSVHGCSIYILVLQVVRRQQRSPPTCYVIHETRHASKRSMAMQCYPVAVCYLYEEVSASLMTSLQPLPLRLAPR